MILTLLAAKGAPGVSTWARALVAVWPTVHERSVLLVDADVAGAGPTGDHLRHGLGDGRCLLRWAASAGRNPLRDELLALDADGRRLLLPGLPDAAGAAVVAPHWGPLLAAVRELADTDVGCDVIVDVGRWGSRHEAVPLVTGADAVAVVLRSDFESVSLTQGLRGTMPRSWEMALLVGERKPYSAREISRALDAPVVGALPIDTRAVARIDDGAWSRSSVARAAAAAAVELAAAVRERAGV